MFTGIVQHQGLIRSTHPSQSGARLVVDTEGWKPVVALGDSVCVNGCCLTVAACNGTQLEFDVVPQTLSLTTLGSLQPGESVNLETAATASTALGGHIVQGHVDGVGLVIGVDTKQGGWLTRIEAPAAAAPFIVERGSIAIDGVSLTVAGVSAAAPVAHHGSTAPHWFEVALIPETLERTTLRARLAGSRVNIEADYMSRLVAQHVQRIMGQPKA